MLFMNKSGISLYLGLCFALGYLFQFAVMWPAHAWLEASQGLRLLCAVVLAVIPAFAAFAAARYTHAKSHGESTFWPIPLFPALRIAFVIPALFVPSYLLSTLLGWTSPQWRMGALMRYLEDSSAQPLPPDVVAIVPTLALVLIPAIGIALGATFFAAFAFLNEWGWRGFLFPRLLRLGKWRAHLLTGLAWALYLLPSVARYYWGQDFAAELWGFALRFVLITLAFGAVLGEIRRLTGSIALSAIALGCFITQLPPNGLWQYLFPLERAPWTGPFGLLAVLVWLFVALFPRILVGKPAPAPAETMLQDGGDS